MAGITAADSARLVLNYVRSLANISTSVDGHGSFSPLFHETGLKEFSAHKQQSFHQRFKESFQLGTVPNLAGGEDGFNDYCTKRVAKTKSGLNAAFRGVHENRALNAPPDLRALFADAHLAGDALNARNSINGALSETPELTNLKKQFQYVQANLDSLGKEFSTEALLESLHKLRDDTLRGIDAQHAQDVERIEQLFAQGSVFRNTLDTLGFNEDSIAALRAAMIEEVNKAHAEAFDKEKFTKAIDESINKVHLAAQKEWDRIFILGQFHDHCPEMRRQLAALNLPANVTITQSEQSDVLKNARLHEMIKNAKSQGKKIVTQGGVEIEWDGKSFCVKLPNRMSPYYQSANNNLQLDLLALAYVIKSFSDKITMTIDHIDDDVAKQYAKEAYEACILAGFDKDKITIKCNGKEMKLEEFMNDSPVLPSLIDKKYEAFKSSARNVSSNCRQQLNELKTKIERDSANVPDQAAPPIFGN